MEVLRRRGWALDQSDVEHGLYAVSWPGRFELVNDEPCFIVDGGHNPQCAQTVAENLRSYFPDSRRVLLVGVLKDKDYAGIFDALDPVADEYVCIAPDSQRALPGGGAGENSWKNTARTSTLRKHKGRSEHGARYRRGRSGYYDLRGRLALFRGRDTRML